MDKQETFNYYFSYIDKYRNGYDNSHSNSEDGYSSIWNISLHYLFAWIK